jgi:amino acid transporter
MSKTRPELSLLSAVIINLNIIIGSGVFINTAELARRAGVLGGICYAIVGLLLFPLILSFARLLQLYPGGGFYSFCEKSLNPFVGFLSTWCYFTTKLSSATLIIHIFVTLMQKMFPCIAHYDPFILDIGVLSVIIALNMLNVRTGSSIQGWLMLFKLFPLFFIIISGMFFLQGSNLSSLHQIWSGIPMAIPLVLHAMLGFETACSISRNIKNPEKNGPRVVLISYGIVILLYVLYQGIFYGIVGSDLAMQSDYQATFPLVIAQLGISNYAQYIVCHMIYLFIALSALSAGFGIVYANMWNLYSLAELKHTIAPHFITRLNKFNIPFICVLAQGVVSFLLMILIRGEQTTFQQLSALGATITYTISLIGLMQTLKKLNRSFWLPIFGLINCAILLSSSLYAMWWSHNIKPLLILTGFMIIGVGIYTKSKRHHEKIDTLNP